jgi:hypothetical protein
MEPAAGRLDDVTTQRWQQATTTLQWSRPMDSRMTCGPPRRSSSRSSRNGAGEMPGRLTRALRQLGEQFPDEPQWSRRPVTRCTTS